MCVLMEVKIAVAIQQPGRSSPSSQLRHWSEGVMISRAPFSSSQDKGGLTVALSFTLALKTTIVEASAKVVSLCADFQRIPTSIINFRDS